MIDKYIEIAKSIDPAGSGSNKKCYIFDDVVLLKGSFVNKGEEDLLRQQKIAMLKNAGVDVYNILDRAVIGNTRYELQERAKGEELFLTKFSLNPVEEQKFLERLDDLSRKDIPFFVKFLEDWDKILQTGLDVDPSKSTNFFYDGETIGFIDLNLANNYERRRPWMLREAGIVLSGCGLVWRCKDVQPEAQERVKIIFQKLGQAGLELGENIDEFIEYVDKYNTYGLKEYFGKGYSR